MASSLQLASSNEPPDEGAAQEVDPVDPAILDKFSEFIVDEHRRRKNRRKDKELAWKEVDRQVAMTPPARVDAYGRSLSGTDWMPEIELPLQAETLEVNCTDARRLMFDDEEDWFRAHAAMDDGYIARVKDYLQVAGNRIKWDQDSADKVTQAAINFFHRRYDFKARLDQLNAEAFKYGSFVYRALMLNEDRMQPDIGGIKMIRQAGPVLVPCSIRSVYLDDSPAQTAHEGLIVQPSFIREYWMTLADLRLAATLGSKSEREGWILENLEGLSGNTHEEHKNQIQLLEFEGDFVHSEGDDVMFAPNVILTVAVSETKRVIRVRGFDFPFRSYGVGHYQRDNVDDPYGVSPLMKGSGLQKAASEALNRTMQAAILNTEPPVRYDPSDWRLANAGGPRITPGAMWASMTKPEAIEIGNPTALFQIYQGLVKQHQDLTGVNEPRLGAQTRSHTTAYAVDVEQARGVVRLVDYVKSVQQGPMIGWLNKAFEMTRKALAQQPQHVYVDQYKGFVTVSAELLPSIAVFESIGASNPQEEEQQNQRFMQITAALIKTEPMMRQMGARPMNLDALRAEAMRRGGITDTEQFFEQPAQPPAGPAVAAAPPAIPPGPAVGPSLPGTPEAVTADATMRLAAAIANGTGGQG